MSQTADILAALRAGHALTPMDALDQFGCFRLAARVRQLREAGHRIITEEVRVGRRKKRVASYRMPSRRRRA